MAASWSPVLPTHLFHSLAGSLLDQTLTKVNSSILSFADIGSDESRVLTELLSPLKSLQSLFEVPDLRPYVPSFIKFLSILEVRILCSLFRCLA